MTVLHTLAAGELDALRPICARSAPVERTEPVAFDEAELKKLAFALDRVDPGPHPNWLTGGMVCFPFGEKGRALWDAWSRGCPEKYSDEAQDRTWNSLAKPHPNRPTVASIFAMADEAAPSWRRAWDRECVAAAFEPVGSTLDEPADEAGSTTTLQTPSDPFAGRWLQPSDEWLAVEPPPQRFLLRYPFGKGQGMLPRGIAALLAGEGGIGKTLALTGLAVAIATGGAWFDHFPVDDAAGKVLFLAAEEDSAEMRRRLFRATRHLSAEQRAMVRDRLVMVPMHGRDVALLFKGSVRDSASQTPFLTALRERLRREAGPDGWAAILVGPLSRLAGVPLDADNANATAIVQALESLTELPGEPTVLVDCHTNADSRKQGKASVRGPTGLVDGVRWWASLHRARDGGPIEFTVRKSNRGPFDERSVILEKDAYGLLQAGGGDEAARGLSEEQRQEIELQDAAQAQEARVLAVMAELGGTVGSREEVFVRMRGKTAAKRAAFAACERRGAILARGRGNARSYTLAQQPSVYSPPYNPPARGARGEDALAQGHDGREGARGEKGRGARSTAREASS